MFYSILLAAHVVVTLMLVGIILIQRSDGDGMGLTSSSSPMMSTRTSANFLTRTTAILATVFILTSLALTITHQKTVHSSLVDQITEEAPAPNSDKPEEITKPETPAVPLRE